MRSIELFTGAGGLALGTHLAGFHHEALIDTAPNAIKTLLRNIEDDSVEGIAHWKGKVHLKDVQDIRFADFAPVDLVAGGPPCQPFSIGGKHQGMSDSRDMIPQFIRAVGELQPKAFIMENVKGLLRKSFSDYFHYTLKRLSLPSFRPRPGEDWQSHLARLEDAHDHAYDGLSYNVRFKLVNAAKYGVPQTRERVFIVGFRSDLNIEWHCPDETHSLDDLLYNQWVSGNYWDRHGMTMPSSGPISRFSKRIEKLKHMTAPKLKPFQTVRDQLKDLPNPLDHGGSHLNHVYQPGAKVYIGHTGSPVDLPSKTLKAGDHGVPGGENMIAYPDGRVRYFTVREAARIQTFPDSWKLEGAWTQSMRQLGNAVPVELAKIIADSVYASLNRTEA